MATIRAWLLSGGVAGDTPGPGRTAVVDIGLACCTLEFEAALPALTGPGPGQADIVALADLPSGTPIVVVVSGTVTDRLLPGVLSVLDACRAVGPTGVVSFGACATSGGPYWDSYAVTKGIDQLVPVTRYVAGCPPTPRSLVDAVRETAAVLGPAQHHDPSATDATALAGR